MNEMNDALQVAFYYYYYHSAVFGLVNLLQKFWGNRLTVNIPSVDKKTLLVTANKPQHQKHLKTKNF